MQDASNVKIDSEWDTARPYKSIPGPSKIALIRGFAPGGKFQKRIKKKAFIERIENYVAFNQKCSLLFFQY